MTLRSLAVVAVLFGSALIRAQEPPNARLLPPALPAFLVHGQVQVVRITVERPLPSARLTVDLSSSRPEILAVPDSVSLGESQRTIAKTVAVAEVDRPEEVVVTASFGDQTTETRMTVFPGTLITFDELDDNVPIERQYENEGVVFPLRTPPVRAVTAITWSRPRAAQVLEGSDDIEPGNPDPMSIRFVEPVQFVRMLTGLRFPTGLETTRARLRALDVNERVVGEDVVLLGATRTSVDRPLSVLSEEVDIYRVELHLVSLESGREVGIADNGNEIIDNLEFYRPVLEPPSFAVEAIDPLVHPTRGGTELRLYGQGVRAGLEVTVGGTPARNPRRLARDRIAVDVPPHDEGFYDVAVRNPAAENELPVVIPDAVEYRDPRLPGVEDVTCTLGVDEAFLTWSTPVPYESIDVFRFGRPVSTLPGDATSYHDREEGLRGNAIAVPYTIVGRGELYDAEDAMCFAAVVNCPTIIQFGSQRLDSVRVPLLGDGANDVATRISIPKSLAGLRVRLHAARANHFGDLRGELKGILQPTSIPFDLGDLAIASGAQWAEGVILEPVPAGDYAVRFWIDGGDAATNHYLVSTDARTDPLGGSFPPPPYPLVDFSGISGNRPPVIHDVGRDETVGIALCESGIDLGGVIVTQVERGLASCENGVPVTLRADATDEDGVIIKYEWRFGDGTPVESATPTVTHVFPDFGLYEVRLTVTDNNCAKAGETVTIDVKPNVPLPPAGAAPKITHLSPKPEDQRFVPDVDPDVSNTYKFLVSPAEDTSVRSVVVRLVGADGDLGEAEVHAASSAVQSDASDPDPQTFWQATFNMSDLPPVGLVRLWIVAEDEAGRVGEELRDVKLCPVPRFFDYDFVAKTVTYDPETREYTLRAQLPDAPLWERTFDVPVIDRTYDNRLDVRLDQTLRFREIKTLGNTDGIWLPSRLGGSVDLELLSRDLVSKRWDEEVAFESAGLACDRLNVLYFKNGIDLYDDAWEWELFDETLWEGSFGPVYVELDVSLTVGVDVDLDADVRVEVGVDEPYADLGVRFIPKVTGWGEGEAEVDVLFGLASVSATLRPELGLALPITLRLQGQELLTELEECVRLSLGSTLEGCVFFGAGCLSKELELFSTTYPDDCEYPEDDDEELRALAGGEARPGLKSPSLATSPELDLSLLVWVEDFGENDVDPEILFSVDRGDGWEAPEFLRGARDDRFQRDVEVTFIDDRRALAVWTENAIPRAEAALLRQSLTDLEYLNAGFAGDEIFYAIWDSRTGWSAPARLTENDEPDGKPVVASVPGEDAAWVAWIHADDAEFVDSTGRVKLSSTSIWAQKIDRGNAVGDPVAVSGDDRRAPAADIAPAIAVDPFGALGAVVWVRDLDGDFNTPLDRMIVASRLAGGAWQAPEALTTPDESPGPLMPSVALSRGGNGIVAFTTRRVDPVTRRVAGEGNMDVVHTVVLADGRFAPPRALERLAPVPGRPDASASGRWPRVELDADGFGVIAFRSFEGRGASGGDGELAIAPVDAATGAPTVGRARSVTSDAAHDLEIDVALRADGSVRTVRNCSDGPPDFSFLVDESLAFESDLAIAGIRASDRHAAPGASVELEIEVTNRGIARPFETKNELRVEIRDPATASWRPVTSVEAILDLVPGGRRNFSAQVVVPYESSRFRVTLVEFDPRGSSADNAIEVELGAAPIADLACERDVDGSVVISWRNADAYDLVRVYRQGRLLALLGGTSDSFVDAEVAALAEGTVTWSVCGAIGESRTRGASCSLDLAETRDEPRFRRGDANADTRVDISDPVAILGYLFVGSFDPSCLESADADDSARVDIADAIYLLNFLFGRGQRPPEPTSGCGIDPTPSTLGCEAFPPCE